MIITTTFHNFSGCKSWSGYHASYLNWMQRVNHPDLRASNWNAQTWKDRNVIGSIPALEESESKSRWPP